VLARAQSVQARRLLITVYGVQQSPQLLKRNQNEINSTWLYPDRADDRRGDYWYFGRCGVAGLSGLHGSRQSFGDDIGCFWNENRSRRVVPKQGCFASKWFNGVGRFFEIC